MVEYSLALAAIFLSFFVSRKLTSFLSYKQEKRREKKRAEESRGSFILSFFLLLVSHTRGHCLSGTSLFSEIFVHPDFQYSFSSAVQ
jgi:hypothetical protein